MGADNDRTPDAGDGAAGDESRLRRYTSAAQGRVEAARDVVEGRRDRVRAVDAGFLIYEANQELPAGFLIGALASRLVIFAVPFFALVVFGLGYVVDFTSWTAEEAARDVGMVGLFAVAIEDSLQASSGVRVTVLLATGWATLWAADSLARMVRRMYAVLWRVPLERPRQRLLLPVMVLTVSLLALVLAGPARMVDGLPVIQLLARIVLEVVVVGVVWLAVSRALPHDPGADWRDFLPGAVLAAVFLIAVRVAMVVYFAPKTQTLQDRYGSISIAVVMILWAYWIGALIVGSALVDTAAFRSRIRRAADPDRADPAATPEDPSPTRG